MSPIIIFACEGAVVSISLIYIASWYVWPKIKNLNASSALTPLLLVSTLRVAGLGLANPALTNNAPQSAYLLGYGDFISAVLALVTLLVLRSNKSAGVSFAWLYAIVGSLDLLFGFKVILGDNLLIHLGPFALTAFLILPTLFISTILIWLVLFKNPRN